MAYDYVNSLDGAAKTRYNIKLNASGLPVCPYQLPADAWTDDPTQWPLVHYADIFHYLIESPGVFTSHSMKNYRSLEAHRLFQDGWVGPVRHLQTEIGHCVFRADVRPSMRINDTPHQPWVTADKEGNIIAGHCNCMAGLGESCSHVAALLFKLEAAVRLGYTSLSCTDVPCQWNNHFVQKVECATLQDILLYKPDYVAKVKNSARKTQVNLSPPSSEQQDAFLQDLLNGDETSLGLSLFAATATPHFQPNPVKNISRQPALLRNLYSAENNKLTAEELQAKVKSVQLTVSTEQANYIEECTREQSSCLAWHEHRAGRITASVAHQCLRTSLQSPAKSLVKKICLPNSTPIRAPALEYGREMEKYIFDTYQNELGKQLHISQCISHTGMQINVSEPWLAASGDGKFTCSCHGSGVLEIKAPFKWKACTPQQAAEDKEFFLDTQLKLKQDHSYYAQVQLQMFVYECNWCDFIVYFGDSKHFVISTIPRDEEYLAGVLPKLRNFWHVVILPELLTRNIELENHETADEETPTKLYCYCKQNIEGAQMVGCDDPKCPYEWVHLECIRPKRKTIPKGKWYCRDCKKKKTLVTKTAL